MTDQLTALRELVAKVEAGGIEGTRHWSRALGLRPDNRHLSAWSAYNGSRDAANALHEALVPGWAFASLSQGVGVWRCVIQRPDPILSVMAQHPVESVARLLASLKAKIAELEATQ